MCHCERRGLNMIRTHCIVCGAELSKKPLYSRPNMPALSQNLPRKDDLVSDKSIEYSIFQCGGCGLVQFNCEPVSYYKDSTRAGERCDVLVELRRKQYKNLIENYNLNGKKLIEIGAGKGGFLKTLKEMNEYSINEYGIENNPEFVRIAQEQMGVNVCQGDIEEEEIKIEGGLFDAFTSFAYPARLLAPNTMLRNIYSNTTDEVVGIIQVPSMEHLLKPGGFFDITRDHIAYYDESTLRFLLQKNGFDVLEFGEVAEIYIYAVVCKRKQYKLADAWSDVDDLVKQVNELIRKIINKGEKIAIWCAGHFAFTVISVAGIGEYISYIIDNAEFKQNCYSPASHVPIYGPEHYEQEPVDNIMILGPIYIDEIVEEIHSRFGRHINIFYMNKHGLKGVE